MREGANELEVLLGNGWFRGRLGWGDRRALYGDRLALLAQLEVTTADGEVHVLATAESWTASESGVRTDDLYDGQRTDLRPRAHGRTDRVEVVDAELSRLVAPDGPPVAAFEVLCAQGGGGSIVFVASKNALVAGKNAAAYSSAKAAELHLARCLAEEAATPGSA